MRSFHRSLALILLAPVALTAQSGYREPPPAIAKVLDADPTPAASISPDRQWLLLMERDGLPPISEVAEKWHGLAGDRINPRTNMEARQPTFKGLVLRSFQGTAERRIALPAGTRVAFPSWSPDAKKIAFVNLGKDGGTLWLADVATGRARQVAASRLNGAIGAPCAWLSTNTQLVCKTIPAGRGAAPMAPETPTGPIIQESEGRVAPNRTYQDLLTSPHDERLFDHFYTSRLALISTTGTVTPIAEAAVYSMAEPSPDGRYIATQTSRKPYSYLVPLNRFPTRIQVLDIKGAVVKTVHERPLQEEIPTSFDAVAAGPRGVQWRSDTPATLVWIEALDGGDPAVRRDLRDKVVMLDAPFNGEPVTLVSTGTRVFNITWARPELAVVTEGWSKTRRSKTWIVNPSRAGDAPRLLWDRSSEDRYNDPGRLLTAPDERGHTRLLTSSDGRYAFLAGAGASSDGDKPFLDRLDLMTGRPERLWRSESPYYEEVIVLLDANSPRALTRRESVKDVPNYFVRDLQTKSLARLTSFADPAPEFAGVSTQLITYRRPDGVQLSATLYLPPGYKQEQGRLPFIFWAYPREFRTRDAAAQVIGSANRFTRPSGMSHLFLLSQGYGVLDGPTMPIVGENGSEPNDTYVEQLVASARAAVDKVVEMGVADRDRIGVGGHSYGAFMTANLLAHSNIFRAGIARSGAYNRTLTPFGFQAEERTYWQSPDIYEKMSPFTYADSIRAPLLLIHGMADDNSGTFPVQSERFYAALKGNGAKVRYVQLPAEAHGYRARESIGHTLFEMVAWMDQYVKPERTKRME